MKLGIQNTTLKSCTQYNFTFPLLPPFPWGEFQASAFQTLINNSLVDPPTSNSVFRDYARCRSEKNFKLSPQLFYIHLLWFTIDFMKATICSQENIFLITY